MKKEKNKKNKNKNTQTITKLTAVIYRYCSLNLYPISWPRPALNFRNLHETSAAELCFYFFHFSFFSFWIFKAYVKREIHTHVHALTAGWGFALLGPTIIGTHAYALWRRRGSRWRRHLTVVYGVTVCGRAYGCGQLTALIGVTFVVYKIIKHDFLSLKWFVDI